MPNEPENNIEEVKSEEVSAEVIPEVQESKNSRRKRERKHKLPSDGFFASSDSPSSDSKGDSKKQAPTTPFDFKGTIKLARAYAPAIEKVLDGYFAMRGVEGVFPVGDAATIETMTCAKYGEVIYYVDSNKASVKGPIQEAFAFHAIVLSGGGVSLIEKFIEKHRGFTSLVAIVALTLHMEFVIKKQAALIEHINKRNAQAVQETYASGSTVDARDTENPSIVIE